MAPFAAGTASNSSFETRQSQVPILALLTSSTAQGDFPPPPGQVPSETGIVKTSVRCGYSHEGIALHSFYQASNEGQLQAALASQRVCIPCCKSPSPFITVTLGVCRASWGCEDIPILPTPAQALAVRVQSLSRFLNKGGMGISRGHADNSELSGSGWGPSCRSADKLPD